MRTWSVLCIIYLNNPCSVGLLQIGVSPNDDAVCLSTVCTAPTRSSQRAVGQYECHHTPALQSHRESSASGTYKAEESALKGYKCEVLQAFCKKATS